MKSRFLLALGGMLLAMVATPRMLAQPGSHPYVFYSEDSAGSSYLGVQTQDITADRVGQLHLKDERGVEVTMVDQDAPASKAGLKEHDVILSVDDQKIESVEQLKRVIREIPPGRKVTIGISREGQTMTLQTQLAARDKMEMDHSFNFTMPPIPPINLPAIHIPPINLPDMDYAGGIVVMHSPARSGLMVENLTPQLGDFFGVKNGSGVLIRSVEKGSRGEQAGFRAGDVVVKINGSAVNDCSDFTRLLRKRTDNKASVTVMRDRKEQTLTLTLPEIKRTGARNERAECISEDWNDCAASIKNELAQIVPEMTTAEIKRLQPEMQKMQKEMMRMRPEMEKMQKQVQRQVETHQQELRKEMEQMQKDLRRQEQEMKEQIRTWVQNSEI
jgi:serine protease Do